MGTRYDFYMNNVLLPVAPSSMSVKIKNQNTTVNLINDGEVSVLKSPGLMEYSFDVLLPSHKYPFAKYISGFKMPKYYLDVFEDLKFNKKPFTFLVSRELPDGTGVFDTSRTVTIEDYTIKEDVKNGFDVVVSMNLKQYKPFQTKPCKVTIDKKKPMLTTSTTRPASNNAPSTGKKYTVKDGDTLWSISRAHYGTATNTTVSSIYTANKTAIENAAKAHGKSSSNNGYWIYPGTPLTIPSATTSATTKSNPSSKTSGGSKTNPPFAILTKTYDVVRAGISTWNEAYGYYMARGGSGKGWKIADKSNNIITL